MMGCGEIKLILMSSAKFYVLCFMFYVFFFVGQRLCIEGGFMVRLEYSSGILRVLNPLSLRR